jgi:hypothetical protein
VERHKSDPFVWLGIDTDEDAGAFAKRARASGINWRNSIQGSPQSATAPRAWGVVSYPTNFVIDKAGRVRSIGLRGDALEHEVDALIAETNAKQ